MHYDEKYSDFPVDILRLSTKGIKKMTRTQAIKRETAISFTVKMIGLVISYLLVSVTIGYLNTERYGIWVTVLSIVSWISFLDIGLGNGMRNKLVQALVKGDKYKAKEYVSTTFYTVMMISLLVAILVVVSSFLLDWQKIFNTLISAEELAIMFLITGLFFAANFALTTFNQVFYAYQRPSLSAVVTLLSNLLALTSIAIAKTLVTENLIVLSLLYGISQLIARIMVSALFFKKHAEVSPSIRHFSSSRIREVMDLGVRFFLIQISAIVIFSTDNMIITQLLGPAEVLPYNVSHKLMNSITFVSSTVMITLWSAFTEAYERRDITWIKRIINKLLKGMFLAVLGMIAIYLLSPTIFRIWLGDSVTVPNSLILSMGIYILVVTWTSIFSHFVNGIGKLNLQLIMAIIGAIINIPLSIVFASWLNMGSTGVVLGSICSVSLFGIAGPIQTYLVLKHTADANQ